MTDKVRHCSSCNKGGCYKRNFVTDICGFDIYNQNLKNNYGQSKEDKERD